MKPLSDSNFVLSIQSSSFFFLTSKWNDLQQLRNLIFLKALLMQFFGAPLSKMELFSVSIEMCLAVALSDAKLLPTFFTRVLWTSFLVYSLLTLKLIVNFTHKILKRVCIFSEALSIWKWLIYRENLKSISCFVLNL